MIKDFCFSLKIETEIIEQLRLIYGRALCEKVRELMVNELLDNKTGVTIEIAKHHLHQQRGTQKDFAELPEMDLVPLSEAVKALKIIINGQ